MNIKINGYKWGYLRERLYSDFNEPYKERKLPQNILSKLKINNGKNIRKISIIITTRNRLEALKEYSLKSLAELNFTKADYEIIIVDNGSNLETYDYFKNLKNSKLRNLKVLRERRKGACYGRNKGIKYATGDIIAFIDDDCYVDRDWLTRIYNLYKKGNYLLGRGYIYDEKLKKIINPYKKGEKEETFFLGNLSFRREVFEHVLFNESMTIYSEDSDLMSQIYIYWPNFKYFIDMKPIKHYSAKSEYRDYGKPVLNENGVMMDRKMLNLWKINKNNLRRNLDVNSRLFGAKYILREFSFFPLELSFVNFDALRLIKAKIIIYKQLKKLIIFCKNGK